MNVGGSRPRVAEEEKHLSLWRCFTWSEVVEICRVESNAGTPWQPVAKISKWGWTLWFERLTSVTTRLCWLKGPLFGSFQSNSLVEASAWVGLPSPTWDFLSSSSQLNRINLKKKSNNFELSPPARLLQSRPWRRRSLKGNTWVVFNSIRNEIW